MRGPKRTLAGAALTDLVLDVFRLSSRLLAAGDRLVADLGLTSARWQILGTIFGAGRPQPVAWLARDMGGNRQNVQRIVNDLEQEGFVEFQPNPHHRRAQLIVLTEKGKKTFDAAMRLQARWANELTEGLRAEDIETTRRIITALRKRLEASGDANEQV
ncbi:MAG: winged helix-turn-helix transcriptional regulator [Hyphomicrobiales bacterium]|nr:winged helix-turn-helix transcriptional regulator [Hyphomicrobiales bacterium]